MKFIAPVLSLLLASATLTQAQYETRSDMGLKSVSASLGGYIPFDTTYTKAGISGSASLDVGRIVKDVHLFVGGTYSYASWEESKIAHKTSFLLANVEFRVLPYQFDSTKFAFYAGAGPIACIFFHDEKAVGFATPDKHEPENILGLNVVGGAEYRLNSRISVFVEPKFQLCRVSVFLIHVGARYKLF